MAIRSTQRKTGRPVGFYKAADGTRIDGLTRRRDGRWRISTTGQFFTEPNEDRAIQHFLEQTSEQKPIVKIVSTSNVASFAAADIELKAAHKLRGQGGGLLIRRGDHWELRLTTAVEEKAYWSQVTSDLLERPALVAAKTGIAAVAWLPDLKKPADSPKLDELIDLYTSKPKLSPGEAGRSKLFWKEFTRWTEATTLRDLTHENVQRYEAKVQAEKLAPKSIKHRFAKIKCIIAYGLKRGQDSQECRRVLDVLGMLDIPKGSPLAPHPISPADFWAFYTAALKAGDNDFVALMLTMANCCMYPGEVSALKWSEVNLRTAEVVTARPKTGVCRVAVLWPETVQAIKVLPHDRDEIFSSPRRSYTAQLVWHWWKRYRDHLKLSDVKPSDIRDAAYTVACRSVSLDKARILAGHRLPGSTDHYVQRNPQFVAEACTAIAKAFDVAKNVDKIAREAAAAKKAGKH